MAGHKYKGYTNDGKPLKISFDVDGDDTPHGMIPDETTEPAITYKGVGKGLCFMSFGSGSSGNCAYLGTPRGGVLIDAGIKPPPKTKRKRKKSDNDVLNLDEAFAELERNGVPRSMVKGVLLTHAHQDHMRCLKDVVNRSDRLFYCTRAIFNELRTRHGVSFILEDHFHAVNHEHEFRILDMVITPFETKHDVKSVGYSIEYKGERFVVGSDMGSITERAAYYMSRANYLMIESNYDYDMLVNGKYSQMLKDRVMKETGHLSNAVAAQFVAEHYHKGLHYAFLCHLSQDNNTEEIALSTMRNALQAKGLTVGDGSNSASQNSCDIQICALPRYNASSWFVLA